MQPKSIILFFYGYILFFRRQMSHRIKLKHKYGLDNLIKIVKLSKYLF